MKFKDPAIEKLFEHLSRFSTEAYKDQLLISNIIFSKQESSGRVLESYLAKEVPKKISPLFIFKKLLIYIVKNILGLILTIITAILHRLSRQNFHFKSTNELIIMDVYFLTSKILDKGEFEDIFFPGFSDFLRVQKKTYAYIPRWYGSKNPLDFFRVFRTLKKLQVPALTQFQILNLFDYLKALQFLFSYPISIFKFLKNLGSSHEDRLIRFALWDNLDSLVLENYFRFLLGQRLSTSITGKIKCISWYENVAADKNFYLGLRTQSEKTEIIGAQLFVKPHTVMNIVPDEKEIPFKVVPDKILVNGLGYRFDLDKTRVEIGPSFRYKHLFDSKINNTTRNFVLVAMPYWDHITSHILNVISEVEWPVPIVIKFHPTTDWKKYKTKIPRNSSVTSQPLPSLLPGAFMAIGHSTGSLIEAAVLGIPSIDIQYPEKFSHDYMPEIGRGILWEKANDAVEIKVLIKKFQSTLQENPESLKEEGKKMRAYCFSEPTEELINKAFELD
jgi:hypothetical protein